MKHNNKKYLVVIAGPTAVGKSKLALKLAEELKTEIISADSRQIYNELTIGTAKPSPRELARVKHHFVNHLPIQKPFTAHQFEEEGLAILANIYRERDLAIVAGGTGLYIQALCDGLDEIPEVPLQVRKHFDELFRNRGIEVLQAVVQEKDPNYWSVVDRQNPRRLIRALSVMAHTGRSFSSFHRQTAKSRPFDILAILLIEDRTILYDQINMRVDEMIALGLEEEVRKIKKFAGFPALQTVGYQEWFPYFEGERSYEEVIRLIKRNSRRYAKRQMTWFNRYDHWHTFDSGHQEKVESFLQQMLTK